MSWGYIEQRMIEVGWSGKRRGRPQSRFLDFVKEVEVVKSKRVEYDLKDRPYKRKQHSG